MKRWSLRALVIAAVLAVGGFVIAASGVIPLKASAGHWALTEWMLRFGMKRSIATHSLGISVPENLSASSLVLKGALHYDVGCRACHGEPGLPRPGIAGRMLPPPPDLAARIRESSPRKLFYVVKHGMKFTGMPAWPSPHRDDEVWAMVAFLLAYPELDAASYRRLVHREPAARVPLEEMTAAPEPPAAVVQSCARCHGDDGRGRGGDAFPRLAGQRKEYLLNAMEAYASGRRHSGMMEPVAVALRPDIRQEIAAYYSGLRPSPQVGLARTSTAEGVGEVPDPAGVERGRLIAQNGIPGRRVPACVECHGPGARRGKPEYPSLAGQSAGFLELQLTLFEENRRGGSAYAHLMKPVASRLTPAQRRDVALYFASLAPEERAAGER